MICKLHKLNHYFIWLFQKAGFIHRYKKIFKKTPPALVFYRCTKDRNVFCNKYAIISKHCKISVKSGVRQTLKVNISDLIYMLLRLNES